MNSFEPLTVKYGWRIGILKLTFDDASRGTISELVSQLRRKYISINSRANRGAIGHDPGAVKHFDELLERTLQPFEDIQKYCHEHNFVLWPSAAVATGEGSRNIYVSAGPLFDMEAGICIRNAAIKYDPAWMALMANSPFDGLHLGEYKCYRLGLGWSMPPMPMEAEGYQPDWSDLRVGHDGLSLGSADSPISPRLVCEYAAFVACFIAALANDVEKNGGKPIGPKDYNEYIHNRWLATKYGLQATFQWKGNEKPVVELLADMLTLADRKLREFGISAQGLKLIHQMLEKRQTQADCGQVFGGLSKDPYVLHQAYANFIAEPNAFETYLSQAVKLPLVEQMSIADEIVKRTKQNSYWDVHFRVKCPTMLFDRLLLQLEREDKIQIEKHPERGILLTNPTGHCV